MRKIYDAVVVTGEYQDRQGNTKKRYLNVGVVLEGDKGLSMKLEALPVNFNGWINFYEPKQREQSGGESRQQSSAPIDDSEIPW